LKWSRGCAKILVFIYFLIVVLIPKSNLDGKKKFF